MKAFKDNPSLTGKTKAWKLKLFLAVTPDCLPKSRQAMQLPALQAKTNLNSCQNNKSF